MIALFNLLFVLVCRNYVIAHPELDGRIIGGTKANITSLPYQVSLQDWTGHFCGGSIIHQNYILTAAHCIEKSAKSLRVRAGSHFHNKGGIVRKVCSVIANENYEDDETDFDNDIAIIKLCNPLPLGPKILPVALPLFNENINDGAEATVSGWGYNNVDYPTHLLKVSLTTFNQNVCRNQYKHVGKITSRMLCAGCKKRLCDSCYGDSGGPLVSKGKLVGIVSWGYGCAQKDYPGVYTRVSKFRKWIKNKIGI